jgi:DNA-directed RNA polymerase specialized sigma24 family protein
VGLLSEQRRDTPTKRIEPFESFVARAEPRLKQAFVARYGRTDGVEATSEALAYAWEHWHRVSLMDNPEGYLYRVGRSRTRRIRRRTPTLPPVSPSTMPDVEPGLPAAMARLPERQRVAVVLVHGLGWKLREVGDLLGISISTVQNHVERGLKSLQRALGETS